MNTFEKVGHGDLLLVHYENCKKLEKLNFRALKHVHQDYDRKYIDLLKIDKSVSLQLGRQRLGIQGRGIQNYNKTMPIISVRVNLIH